MDVPVPHMQHHLKCGSPRIPAIDGDGLILGSIPLSVLACWTAKRSWSVISSPATFSPSPVPRTGHVPATEDSWLIESSRALVGLRRWDKWPKHTPLLGRVLDCGLDKFTKKLCGGPWFCDFCSYLSLLMTDPRLDQHWDGNPSPEASVLTVELSQALPTLLQVVSTFLSTYRKSAQHILCQLCIEYQSWEGP